MSSRPRTRGRELRLPLRAGDRLYRRTVYRDVPLDVLEVLDDGRVRLECEDGSRPVRPWEWWLPAGVRVHRRPDTRPPRPPLRERRDLA